MSTSQSRGPGSKSSIVWKFFPKPADRKQAKIKCPICPATEIAFGGTTSGIKGHLQTHHTTKYIELLRSEEEGDSEDVPLDHSDSLLARAFSTSLVSFRFVENPELQQFVKSISRPGYRLPSRHGIRKLIEKEALNYNHELKFLLEGVERYTILTDGFTNRKRDFHFYSLHLAFIDSKFNRKVVFGGLQAVEKGDATGIASALCQLLGQLGLSISNCSALASDAASPLVSLASTHNLDKINCSCHQLNIAIEEFAEIREVQKIQMTAQDLARHLSRRKDDKSRLKAMAHDSNIKSPIPLPLAPTRWAALHILLDSYLAHFDSIKSLASLQRFVVKPEGLEKMKEVVELLKPIHDGILKLERDHSYASEILPTWIWIRREVSKSASSLAPKLLAVLDKRMDFCTKNGRLLSTMIIDPRFGYSQKYLPRQKWEEAETHIEQYDKSPNGSVPQTPPISAGSSLDDFFHENTISTTNDLTTELKKYRIILEMDRPTLDTPLSFWKAHSKSFPILWPIAMELLCTPASSAVSERTFSRCTDFLRQVKRNRSKLETLNSLLTVSELSKMRRGQQVVESDDDDDDEDENLEDDDEKLEDDYESSDEYGQEDKEEFVVWIEESEESGGIAIEMEDELNVSMRSIV